MTAKRTPVVFDRWETYVARSDDNPLFVSFDAEAAEKDMTDQLTHCARVIIPIHRPNTNGGPVSPENERLYELEDQLCAKLVRHGAACRLVARLTCAGIRQLVFQLDDWGAFRPPVGLWLMEHDDYAIDVSEHEGWAFFNDYVRPTPDDRLYLADQRVVQELLKAGGDPSKVHAVEFVFVGEERGLRQAAQILQRRGYLLPSSPDYKRGQIVMVKRMSLDQEAIFAESQAHRATAASCGIKYDGWGAQVVR